MKTQSQSHIFEVKHVADGEYAVYRLQAGVSTPVTGPTRDVKTLNSACRNMAKRDGVQAFTRDGR